MSKIHVTPALFESKFQIAPAAIVFHRELSDACVRLILAINQIKHSAPNWVILQEDLQHRLSFGRDKMKKTMMEAVKFGYLRIRQVRQEKGKVNAKGKAIAGQFYRNDFDFNIEGTFEPLPEMLPNVDERSPKPAALPVEALEPTTEKPSTAKPSTERSVLPMPDKPMPRLKALEGNASLSSKSKAVDASRSKQDPAVRGRKHKRPDDEEDRFQWLIGLQILDEKGYLNEDALSYLAHTYTRQRLEDAYYHMLNKIQKKSFKAKSPIAVFRHLLENEHNCRGTNAELNEAFARKFASDLGWGTLQINEKYVIDKNVSAKDLGLNMEPKAFRSSLENLYLSIHGSFTNG
jgi:hypothetical protein